MNKLFYIKLALVNLKKNKNITVPYLITSIGSVMFFFIMSCIHKNEAILTLRGGGSLVSMLGFGVVLIGIFAVLFLFYTNSFIIKRRKKELGLYHILGMEKKHIGLIMFWETFITYVISVIIGLVMSMLFGKLLFLILINIVGYSEMEFVLNSYSLWLTIALFSAIFFVSFLYNLWQVNSTDPINLLKGQRVGEREPKTKRLLTIFGILCLGGGYTLAIMVEDPLQAIPMFFLAVLLVVAGTYSLFTAGSIFLLKRLKKNKKFFYQPKHFISVSGMIYRMKQNAVGLANICILSTMILVMLSVTICLYAGSKELIRSVQPYDVMADFAKEKDQEIVKQLSSELTSKYQLSIGEQLSFSRNSDVIYGSLEEPQFATDTNDIDIDQVQAIFLVTLDDYNSVHGTKENLEEGEILLYSKNGEIETDVLNLNGMEFTVKDTLDSVKMLTEDEASSDYASYLLVVKDEAARREIMESLYNSALSALTGVEAAEILGTDSFDDYYDQSIEYYYWFNLVHIEEEEEACKTFIQELFTEAYESYDIESYRYTDIYSTEETSDADFGGLLYLGVILGTVFLMACVLIIYYKQISEGYDDRERFVIMQKVGLSKEEVKSTIRSQTLMVFYLPLIGAVVHLCFAFKMLLRLLSLFRGMNNFSGLFVLTTVGTVAVFSLIYFFVYMLTARTYYKIVQA